jgi:cell division protein FtsB
MRIVALILTALLAFLNYQLWLSEDRGFQKVWLLKDAIKTQRTENAALSERNQALEAEVKDLKNGLAAVEERARAELGMVRQGETFFHLLDGLPAPETTLKPSTLKPPAAKQATAKRTALKSPAPKRTALKPSTPKPATLKPSTPKPAALKPPAAKPSVHKPARQEPHGQPVQKQQGNRPAVQKQNLTGKHA